MTNYTVNSPQILLTGTTSNDVFDLNTAVGVSIAALAGNDVFSGIAEIFTQASLNGGAGNDTFDLNAGPISAVQLSIYGDDGEDILSGDFGSQLNRSLIQGGNDNDFFTIEDISGERTTIGGNQGLDSIFVSGLISAGKIVGGGDSDTITLSGFHGDSATIQAGGGNDIISGTFAAASTAAMVAGDTELVAGAYDGNDTIVIQGGAFLTDGLVQGNGGNDVLTISGVASALTIGGNAGLDSITLSGVRDAVRSTVNLGGDADVLSASVFSGNTNFSINGGGGEDTITVSAASGALVGNQSAFIFGGADADVINLVGAGFGQASGVMVSYASAAESNLAATDAISSTFALSTGITTGYRVFVDYTNLVTGSTADSTQISIRGTEALFTATFALGTTARVNALDTFITQAGSTVFFNDGTGIDHLFVQGGSGSTTNDLVVTNATGEITGLAIAQRGPGLVGGTIGITI